MEITRRSDGSTTYKTANGQTIAFVYCNKGHWYACDADGNDLDYGWRLDSQANAERIAESYALRVD